jgi:DASS family divalent anion:Na+ symporter
LAGGVVCLERFASLFGDVGWSIAYVVLLLLYVLMHYMFVSQSAQTLALLGVFLDVGVQTGVPVSLMGFAPPFASSYFSMLTPQRGSQNVIFVASGYLDQGELYRLGLLATALCALVFLVTVRRGCSGLAERLTEHRRYRRRAGPW